MPKRPDPPGKPEEKEEAKKPRTDGGDDAVDAGFMGRISAAAYASAGRVSEAASRVSAAVLPAAVDKPPSSSSKSAKSNGSTSSKATSNGSSSGGNAFLKSLRAVSSSMAAGVGAGAKKPTPTTVAASSNASAPSKKNGKKKAAKADPDSNGSAPVANGGSSGEEPVVPFPHLPLDNETRLKKYATPLLLFLFVLNVVAVAYVASIRSSHAVDRMKRNLEVNRLADQLAASQHQVNVLRQKMGALEGARDAGEDASDEAFTGIFGEELVGGGDDAPLTVEERDGWLQKLHKLEAETRSSLEGFNRRLSEFE